MKVAILYICTGEYNQFFKKFYESSNKYLLKDEAVLQYFIFTDNLNLSDADNVHIIEKKCEGFPKDSLFRFEMFLQIRSILLTFDYIFFFNANTEFKHPVGKEILPNGNEGLVLAEWPGKRKPFKHPLFYPYERNRKSLAYVAPFEKRAYLYYMGGINGGKTHDFICMIETLSQNIREDFNHGIIARVHDESHINKYMRTHECKVLSPEYCWPEEWNSDFEPKIIFRDKVKINPFFNKGRNTSFKSRIYKMFYVLWNAIRWPLGV